MLNGIDFSFGSGLTTAEIKNGGKQFVCRYLSGGNSKDISKTELDNYKAAGIPVIFVWETDGIMRSEADGIAAAKAAEAELAQIGASGAVVFFAADAAQMPDLTGYLKGVNSVLGKPRTGVYGGLGSVQAAFNGGLVSYGWQTYAWSNGQWDDRALLRQVQNGVQFGPAQVDLDQAAYWNSTKILGLNDDFGQWPRPPATPPPAKGPVWNEIPDGYGHSLEHWVQQRNGDFNTIVALSRANLNALHLAMLNTYLAYDAACVAAGKPHPPADRLDVYTVN